MEKERRKRPCQKAPSKPSKTSKYDITKMMEERAEFYKGLKEIEELKKAFSRMIAEDEAQEKEAALNEEVTKKDVLSRVRINGDKPPGKQVFFPVHYCQCFSMKKIEKIKLPDDLTYDELRTLLHYNMEVNHVITNEAMFSLFLLMSLEEDEAIIESCYQLLEKNIATFTPKFHHVINVFLNWGATCETLNINEGEKNEVYRKGIRIKKPDSSYTFTESNYSTVIDYLGKVCVLRTEVYSKTEKAILLKCLFRMSLDKTFTRILTKISTCVSKVIESFTQWDDFIVANVCRLIHDDKDHFHNQVALIMNTIPQIKRCNDILSCIYYRVFRVLVGLSPKYDFPYEDDKIVEIVNAIQVEADEADDLYRLYVIMQLLNYIVYHRNLHKNEDLMKHIYEKLNELKWVVGRSIRTFDGAFVKARISYCCAMWSLSIKSDQKA